jgi:glycolate oxidase iron-sulfur subunit
MQSVDYRAELSKCVRCGGCRAYCPTYDEALTEPMTARGRVMLLLGLFTGRLTPTPELNERIFSCLLCGACERHCPLRVDVTGAMYRGRALLKDSDTTRRLLRFLAKAAFSRPGLCHHIGKLAQPVIGPVLDRWRVLSHRPSLAAVPLRNEPQVHRPEKKIGRVALFAGCAVNYIYADMGRSLIRLLLRLGYEVVIPKGEVCCGAPLRSVGLEEEAVTMARQNLEIFGKLKADAVLSLCPTCVVALKHHYPAMIGEGLGSAQDISQFLSERLGDRQPRALTTFSSVTYHDPCHLAQSLGVRTEPRELIRRTGAELIEADGEGCCGFGGLYSLHHRETSRSMLAKRADSLRKTGASAVVTACPGCMLQLSGGVGQRVYHLVELLEEAFLPTTLL